MRIKIKDGSKDISCEDSEGCETDENDAVPDCGVDEDDAVL